MHFDIKSPFFKSYLYSFLSVFIIFSVLLGCTSLATTLGKTKTDFTLIPTPTIESISFGVVNKDSSKSETFKINYSDSSDYVFDDYSFDNPDGVFSILYLGSCDVVGKMFTVSTGGCTVVIRFSPTSNVSKNYFTSLSFGETVMEISATGRGDISEGVFDTDERPEISSESTVFNSTIKNNTRVMKVDVFYTGADDYDAGYYSFIDNDKVFSISITGGCTVDSAKRVTISTGGCAINITFKPTAAIRKTYSASLIFDKRLIDITGTGLPAPIDENTGGDTSVVPVFNRTSIDFGSIEKDATSTTTINVTYSGASTYTLSPYLLTDNDNVFSISYSSGCTVSGATLKVNRGGCIITVQFKPTSNLLKSYVGFIQLGSTTIQLSGTGLAGVVEVNAPQFATKSIAFGAINSGTSKSTTITVSYTGRTNYTLTPFKFEDPGVSFQYTFSNGCSGSVATNTLYVHPGGCSFTFTFSPKVAGVFSATFTAGSDVITLTGTAINGTTTATTPTISPQGIIEIGNVELNTIKTIPISISYYGTNNYSLTFYTVAYNNAFTRSVTSGCTLSGNALTVKPGGCTMYISFSPVATVRYYTAYEFSAPGFTRVLLDVRGDGVDRKPVEATVPKFSTANYNFGEVQISKQTVVNIRLDYSGTTDYILPGYIFLQSKQVYTLRYLTGCTVSGTQLIVKPGGCILEATFRPTETTLQAGSIIADGVSLLELSGYGW